MSHTIWNVNGKVFKKEIIPALMGDTPLKGVSFRELLRKAARVTVVHREQDGRTFANVASIKPMKAGAKIPEYESKLIYLSLDPDEFNQEDFDALPESERKRIEQSETYKNLQSVLATKGKTSAEIIKDQIPGEPAWEDEISL